MKNFTYKLNFFRQHEKCKKLKKNLLTRIFINDYNKFMKKLKKGQKIVRI